MSLLPISEVDSETFISAEVSTVPTTPEGSLNGGTDKVDAESSGTRTTVYDADSDSSIDPRPVRTICCVGAGYVGMCCILLAFLQSRS
jgi:UDPglucose 6-dehydrogenase